MVRNPEIHNRRSIRLQGYDYAQNGAYFGTLCTHNNACLFGDFDSHDPSVVLLSAAGLAADQCWQAIPDHFPFVELDAFVIMPDHVHGILSTNDCLPLRANRANDYSPLPDGMTKLGGMTKFGGTTKTIGSVVRGFKIGVTKWFKENSPETETVWQRNC